MASALISMICFGKHESLDHKKLKNKRKNGRTYKTDEHGLPCCSNSLMKSARSACEISQWSTRTEIQRACEQLPLCNNCIIIMQLQIQYGVIKWRPWQQNLTFDFFKSSAGKNLNFWSSLLLLLIFHIT